MLVAILFVGIVFASSVAFSQSQDTTNIAVSTMVRIQPDKISDADFDRIDSGEAGIMKLADLYNFKPTTETYVISQMLRCPLWTKRIFVEFSSLEAIRVSSAFIAVISKRDGTLGLIPLSYHGLGPMNYDATFDPHNIAIFNQTIDEEKPSLNRDSDWIQLAGCYLDLVGRFPQLGFAENLRKLAGVSDERVLKRLSPSIQVTESSAQVTVYEVIADERYLIRWELSFDRGGFLRDISKDSQLRGPLLRP